MLKIGWTAIRKKRKAKKENKAKNERKARGIKC